MGFSNYLETNGTLPDELAEVIDDVNIVAMDIKLPSSTGQEFLGEKHERFLSIASRKDVFVKSVICSTTTDEDFMKMVRLIRKVNSSVILVLQPNGYENHGMLDSRMDELREKCRKEGLTACGIGQVQKKLGIR
jgi:pyruvate-formate lyase-activating enzyme